MISTNDRRPDSRRVWVLLSLALAFIAMACPPAAAQSLTESDFRQIGEQGFGDSTNSYPWAIAEFKGKIYIGSNRNFLCLIQALIGTGQSSEIPEFPLVCADSLLENDFRARLFSYDPASNQIELVYMSPTLQALLSDGSLIDVPRDVGYRTMSVFTEPDGTEALYVGTFTSRQLPGPPARILRSVDGVTFEEVITPFSEDEGFTAFRSMTVYKNRLYVCVVGQSTNDSVLLEASHPASGDFRVIHTRGFGDPTNDAPYSLAVFKGFLYVGTGNSTKGFQLFKTQAAGEPPYFFQRVLVDGAYRGVENQNVVSLGVYKDYLYVGTGILFGGNDVIRDVGPAPAELLRVKADDTWELICGVPRDTVDGYKVPLSGMGPGFGNPFTGYMWRMIEHDGVFYLGTFDSSYIAQFAEDLTVEDFQELLEDTDPSDFPIDDSETNLDELFDVISAVEGGFDLWSTTNGIAWARVTRSGFGDLYNYGARSLHSTSYGLFLGGANPFFGFKLYLGQPAGTDTDRDGVPDAEDNCPMVWNLDQSNIDGDASGDVCDIDRDNDCIPDAIDDDPETASLDELDTDADGIPDVCDDDDDGDTVVDFMDNCPLDPNFSQLDADGDGLGDACEPAQNNDVIPSGTPVAQETPGERETAPAGTGTPVGLCGSSSVLSISLLLTGCTLLRRRRRIVRNG